MGKPITVIAGVDSREDKVGTGEYGVLPVSLIYVAIRVVMTSLAMMLS
jgi:hypothetical protein